MRELIDELWGELNPMVQEVEITPSTVEPLPIYILDPSWLDADQPKEREA